MEQITSSSYSLTSCISEPHVCEILFGLHEKRGLLRFRLDDARAPRQKATVQGMEANRSQQQPVYQTIIRVLISRCPLH